MKEHLITIDGGTTNTRAVLWNRERKALCMVRDEIGVKQSAQGGSCAALGRSVKKLLENQLCQSGLTYEDISAVYASGMLTSNVGLYEVKHLEAPAGLEDFAENVKTVRMNEICPLPIHFIPGLKNKAGKCALADVEEMDIMRGEETETLALLDLFPLKEGGMYVLPGSHTKFVAVNREAKITGCLTSLAGEMIEALTRHTLLADAVGRSFAPEAYSREMLLAGSRSTLRAGLTRAAFLTRIVNQFISNAPADSASFLLGTVLAEDIRAVKESRALGNSGRRSVVIAGKEPLQSALKEIFKDEGSFGDIRTCGAKQFPPLSGYGACMIAGRRGDI